MYICTYYINEYILTKQFRFIGAATPLIIIFFIYLLVYIQLNLIFNPNCIHLEATAFNFKI